MKKNRLNVFAGIVVTCLVAPMCMAGSYFTNVASHATPMLVKEVNVALNNIEDRMDGTAAATAPARTSTVVTNYQVVTYQSLTTSNKMTDGASWVYRWNGKDDLNGDNNYVQFEVITEDYTATSEDGGFRIKAMVAGTAKYLLTMNTNAGGTVVLPTAVTIAGTSTLTGKSTHSAGAGMGDYNITDVNGALVDFIAAEGGSSITASNAWSFPGSVSVDSKYVLCGPNATTEYFSQFGSGAAVDVEVTFPSVFKSVPKVLVSYDNTIVGRNEAAYVSGVASNVFTPKGYSGSTFTWWATGTR